MMTTKHPAKYYSDSNAADVDHIALTATGPLFPSKIIFQFVGHGSWIFIASVCRSWRSEYRRFCLNDARTFSSDIIASVPRLQWAMESGYEWSPSTCMLVAKTGNMNVMKWANENGCRWDSRVCVPAASGGHLNILMWAKENGCPSDPRACLAAMSHGRTEVLSWMWTDWYEWTLITCLFAGRMSALKQALLTDSMSQFGGGAGDSTNKFSMTGSYGSLKVPVETGFFPLVDEAVNPMVLLIIIMGPIAFLNLAFLYTIQMQLAAPVIL